MTNMKYLFIAFSFLSAINVYSQENAFNTENLLGEWNSYKVTTPEGDNGSDMTFNGKPFEKKLMMNFIDSETMVLMINGSEEIEIEYLLKDDMLIIGHKKYTIKKLAESELVLKEERLLGNLIYLKKDDS